MVPYLSERRRTNPKYLGDHLIRHYRSLGLAALLRDLGLDPSTPEYEIIGGIGRLVLYADGSETWEPTVTRQPPPPLPADPALVAARQSVCASCDSMRDGRCTASGCGCAGEGKPAVWSSRCPLGRWPTNH